MVKEFYKSGDCELLISAKEQIETAEERRDLENKKYWTSFKNAVIDKVNQIWRIGVCTIWEEETHGMPGFEDLLKDISNAGYHVHVKQQNKHHTGEYQYCYTISLEQLDDGYYGKEMTFESKEENN